ncbi:hypothetical protein M1349_05650 [Patescibacteria group bacterium]|nr:hypothetical protein [Patescibacteria group bacterium]
MSEKDFAFANIVSTPTTDSWSQAYHAGKLFAVLSLKDLVDNTDQETERESLGSIGKTFFTSLEQEFFTLEEKDLDSIKSAIELSLKKIPKDVSYSLAAGSIIGDVFYVFCSNYARVDFKRDNQIGALLVAENEDLKVASGRLLDTDMAILQTKQFNELVDNKTLYSSLDHNSPAEIAENLAPSIHDKEEGGAAAIIIHYKKAPEEFYAVENFSPVEKEPIKHHPAIDDEPLTAEPILERRSPSQFLSFLKKVKLPKIGEVNKSGKLILIVVVVIAALLSGSIYLNVKRQNDAKIKTIFNQVYQQAQDKYNEGQSLSELNQNLARDSFTAAKKIIDDSKGKLPEGSNEEKTIKELAEKIDKALTSTSGVNSSSAKEAPSDASSLLAFEMKNSGTSFSTDGKNNFYIDDKGVSKEDKQIIKNDNSWNNPAGLGVYFGNIYVLDKAKGGIIKFVPAGSGFSKSTYFTGGTSPDLSSATGMAIDGSIWITLSNGGLLKFTRGASDNLKVSGLDKPLSNPTKIWTNVDSERVYVLDKGNGRIVVLDKTGAYKEQYQAGIIKNAKDFDISEKDKKILILSGGKIYEIDLK